MFAPPPSLVAHPHQPEEGRAPPRVPGIADRAWEEAERRIVGRAGPVQPAAATEGTVGG